MDTYRGTTYKEVYNRISHRQVIMQNKALRERVRAGGEKYRASGRHFGRPRKKPNQKRVEVYLRKGKTPADIVRPMQVSQSMLYNRVERWEHEDKKIVEENIMDIKDVSADARVRLAAFVRIHKGHGIDIGNIIHEAKNEKALMIVMMQKHEELETGVSFAGEKMTLRKVSIRKLRSRAEDPTVPQRLVRWRMADN